MRVVEGARGGEGLPESLVELAGAEGSAERNWVAWGHARVRRRRGKREEMLAFKWAWSSEGLMEAIT